MKILIFTAKYGNGHLQVTKTLNDILNENSSKQTNIQSYEPISKTLKPIDKIIDIGYNKIFLQNSQKLLFRQLYDKSCFIFGSRFNMFTTRIILSPFVGYIFLTQKPDVIMQTFPFHSIYKPNIPNLVFITDYGVHNFWADKKADHFFVATDYTKNLLIKKNISADKITVSGIPIASKFSATNENNKVQSILLTFGANGIKFNKKHINQFLELANKNIHISIICGKNQKLYKQLEKLFADINNIKVLGYINNMDELIKKHDLLITKPGGITLTEAIYSETPVIINTQLSILGQEKFNIDFVKHANIGILSNNNNILNDTLTLINDPQKYVTIVQNMRSLKLSDQHVIIKNKVNEIINTYNSNKNN